MSVVKPFLVHNYYISSSSFSRTEVQLCTRTCHFFTTLSLNLQGLSMVANNNYRTKNLAEEKNLQELLKFGRKKAKIKAHESFCDKTYNSERKCVIFLFFS